MHGLATERRCLHGKPLSHDLAARICKDAHYCKVAVVTDKPVALLSSTRKRWLKLIRLTRNELSSTLNPVRKRQLAEQISWMQRVTFSATPPEDMLIADVTFATADDFLRTPPDCHTVYVAYDFEREKLHMLTSWMPTNGIVVIYE